MRRRRSGRRWDVAIMSTSFASRASHGEQSVALDRAGITVFRDTTFLAAVPAAPAGLRCAGLGAWWPGNGGAGKGREGAEAVDVD